MIRAFFALSIKFYQKFISPHKGFVCASNVLHKNGSCSKRIMDIVKTRPIFHWKSLIKEQFSVCKQANTALINKREENNDPERNKNNKGSNLGCEALGCLGCLEGI
jgi:hypothetical protein